MHTMHNHIQAIIAACGRGIAYKPRDYMHSKSSILSDNVKGNL